MDDNNKTKILDNVQIQTLEQVITTQLDIVVMGKAIIAMPIITDRKFRKTHYKKSEKYQRLKMKSKVMEKQDLSCASDHWFTWTSDTSTAGVAAADLC